MVAGELYRADDPELERERLRARELTARYNSSEPSDRAGRRSLLEQLLASMDEDAWIEPPFYCDYGWNITLGARAFLNFNCVVLDCAPIVIGDGCLIGPAVQLCAATHPLDAAIRADQLESAGPITLGGTWIGAGVIVGPNVAIGDNSVVGAGSVVLNDVPANVLAAGSTLPCPSRALGSRQQHGYECRMARYPTAEPFLPETRGPDLPRRGVQELPRLRLVGARDAGGVRGKGRAAADVMLVGEQPGDREDLAGKPFVGPAGRLLDEALERAGIDRSRTYLTNAVKHFKWKPRGPRRIHDKPSWSQITACRPWLEAEASGRLARAVVLLGQPPHSRCWARRYGSPATAAATKSTGWPSRGRHGPPLLDPARRARRARPSSLLSSRISASPLDRLLQIRLQRRLELAASVTTGAPVASGFSPQATSGP